MDTLQLKCVVQSDPVVRTSTLGVYAADQIPRQIQYGGFITNTDASSKPGKHWCAFFFDGAGQSEFFDSYGQPPEYYHNTFASCLRNNSRVQLHNSIKLQSDYSNVCGQYCLYFLINRARGRKLKDIVETLRSIDKRDQYLYDYISKRFPYCQPKSKVQYNQSCLCQNKSL